MLQEDFSGNEGEQFVVDVEELLAPPLSSLPFVLLRVIVSMTAQGSLGEKSKMASDQNQLE